MKKIQDMIKHRDMYPQHVNVRNSIEKIENETTFGVTISFFIMFLIFAYIILYIIWFNKTELELTEEHKFSTEKIPNIEVTSNWMTITNKSQIHESMKKLNDKTFFTSIGFGFVNLTSYEIIPIDLSLINIELINILEIKQSDLKNYKDSVNNFFNKLDKETETKDTKNEDQNKNDFLTIIKPLFYKMCEDFKGFTEIQLQKNFDSIKFIYCLYSNFTLSENSTLSIKVNSCKNKTYTAIDSEIQPDFYDKSIVLPLQFFRNDFKSKCPNNFDYNDKNKCYLYKIYDKYSTYLIDYYLMKIEDYENPNFKTYLEYVLNNLELQKEKSNFENEMIDLIKKSLENYSQISLTYEKQELHNNYISSYKNDLSKIYQLAFNLIESENNNYLNAENSESIDYTKTYFGDKNFTNKYIYTQPLKNIFIPYAESLNKIKNQYIECKPQTEIARFLNETSIILVTSFEKLEESKIINDFQIDIVKMSNYSTVNFGIELSKNLIEINENSLSRIEISRKHKIKEFITINTKNKISTPKLDNLNVIINFTIGSESIKLIYTASDILIMFFTVGGLFILLYVIFYFLFNNYFYFIANLKIINELYSFKFSDNDETISFEEYIKLKFYQIKIKDNMLKNSLKNRNQTETDRENLTNNTNSNKKNKLEQNNFIKKPTRKKVDPIKNFNKERQTLIDDFISKEDDIIFCYNYLKLEDLFQNKCQSYKKVSNIKRTRKSKVKILGHLHMNLNFFLFSRFHKEKQIRFSKLKLLYLTIQKNYLKKLEFNFIEYLGINYSCCYNSKSREKIELYKKANNMLLNESNIINLIKSYFQIDSILNVFFSDSNYKVFNHLPNKSYLTKIKKSDDNTLKRMNNNIINNYNLENSKVTDEFKYKEKVSNILKSIIKISDANDTNRNCKNDEKLLKAHGFSKDLLQVLNKIRIRNKNAAANKINAYSKITKTKVKENIEKFGKHNKKDSLKPEFENFVKLVKKSLYYNTNNNDKEEINERYIEEINNQFNK